MNRLIEIRSYSLKPGTRPAFHAAMAHAALPMVRASGMDVVAFGPSPHEPDAYFLVRAYEDAHDRQTRQDAFYGSEAWRQGPRESLVSRIESSLDTLLWLSPQAIQSMRELNAPAAPGQASQPVPADGGTP